jgi:hypothetical protein
LKKLFNPLSLSYLHQLDYYFFSTQKYSMSTQITIKNILNNNKKKRIVFENYFNFNNLFDIDIIF